eukprot:COSAG04_NODE_8170_length_1012_cov_0.958379_1_plen_118_part_01
MTARAMIFALAVATGSCAAEPAQQLEHAGADEGLHHKRRRAQSAQEFCQEIRRTGSCTTLTHMCPDECGSGQGPAAVSIVTNYVWSCPTLMQDHDCSYDLHTSDPAITPGTTVGSVCP